MGFAAVESYTYTPLLTKMEESLFHDHKEGLILYQPNLTYFPVSNNGKYGPNDFHIWGKLIKTNLYRKSINNFGRNALGELRNECFVIWAEELYQWPFLDMQNRIYLFENTEFSIIYQSVQLHLHLKII